jgi:hypothetical protein
MVNSDGSHARLLAARTNVLGWIRNDRLLALHRGALVAVDADSGALTTLDADTHAGSTGLQGWDLAPDGSSIAYGRESSTQLGAYCGPGADIWVVPVDGGRPRRVTTNHRSRFPVWGGRFIAFRRDPRGCFAAEIWKVRPDGSQLANLSGRPPKRFSQFGYYGYAPFAWLSADKLLIGLVNEWGDEAAILGPGRRVRRLKWYVDDVSRDGRWFVGTNGGAEGPYDIAIVEVGRARARVVAHGNFCCPDWNR